MLLHLLRLLATDLQELIQRLRANCRDRRQAGRAQVRIPMLL